MDDLVKKYTNEELATIAISVAMDKKAFKPILINIKEHATFTEYFAIVSANNARQVAAIADAIKVFFKRVIGYAPLSIDGLETSTWVLLDFGSFIVHVFQETTRDVYKLEQLWSKCRFEELSEEKANALYDKVKNLNKTETNVVS